MEPLPPRHETRNYILLALMVGDIRAYLSFQKKLKEHTVILALVSSGGIYPIPEGLMMKTRTIVITH